MEKDIRKKILDDDEFAINWLMKKIEDEENLVFSGIAGKLLKYAEKTLEDLKSRDFSNIEKGEKELKEIIEDVQKRLEDNTFSNKCLISNSGKKEYSLNTFTQEEIDEIKNLTDEEIKKILEGKTEEDKKLKGRIIKINRFYNMQLKYAHTAKTVSISEEMYEKMGIKSKTIQEIMLTSAVLHDVGRFYQALEYDSFGEAALKGDEIFDGTTIEDNDKEKDHASAGYFYSMTSLFEMNNMNDISDREALIFLIAAFNVRFHQKSNSQMQLFDMPTHIKDSILSLEELEEGLVDFIYEMSPFLNVEKKHKEYIRNFLEEILQSKLPEQKETINSLINKIMLEIDKPGEENDFLKKVDTFFRENKDKEEIEEELPELIDELIKLIEEEIEINVDDEKKFAKILTAKLKEMVDFDVAYGIYNIYEKSQTLNNNSNILTENKYEENMFISKIDILKKLKVNCQNLNNKLSEMSINDFSEKYLIEFKRSLENYFDKIEILMKNSLNIEKYKVIFAFPFNCLTDADKTEVWNQRARGTFPTDYNPKKLPVMISEDMKHEEFFKELGIVDEEEKKKIISEYEKGQKEKKEGIFESIVYIPKKYAYTKYYQENSDKKVEAILTQEDSKNFYKYDGMNRVAKGPIRALLWTINQFIFTNTRTKASLEIIKENNFLERTYQNYPEDIQKVLKPYIQYALYYIDEMIKYDSEIFNAKIMEEQCEKIYNKYQNLSNEEKNKYSKRLEKNKFREEFE